MFAGELIVGGYIKEKDLEEMLVHVIVRPLGSDVLTTGPVSSAKGVPVLFTSNAARGVLFLASVATILLMSLVHEIVDCVKSASRMFPVPSWNNNRLSPSPNATMDTDESLNIP